jgi:hypothetical protein
MKATFDIPDDLYRRVKARSAVEGRPLRSVAVELFQNWLSVTPAEPKPEDDSLTEAEMAKYPWLKITQPYIHPGMSHDLDEMKEAIARGWGEEISEKLREMEEES